MMPLPLLQMRSGLAVHLTQAAFVLLAAQRAPRLCARAAHRLVEVARAIVPELRATEIAR